MNVLQQANSEQSALWNGTAARGWIELQELLDRIFEPLENLLAEAAAARPQARALDVGCGTGATTLAVARRLGAKGRCVGVDISAPMVAVARARAESEGSAAQFAVADAQTHAFEPGGTDLILSRFGVMFFDDPVAAFANLRRAASDRGELCVLAWRGATENPFMTVAERAAAPLLQSIPARAPEAPGQFAFADPERVRRILTEAGWGAIDISPVDVACRFPARDLVRYFTRLGPLARVLHTADERTRAGIVDAVRAAFDPYVRADEVRFDAACWRIGARSRRSPSAADGADDE